MTVCNNHARVYVVLKCVSRHRVYTEPLSKIVDSLSRE